MPGKFRPIPRVCVRCGQAFHTAAAQVRRGNGLFCSHSCASSAVAGPRRKDEATRFWAKVDKSGPLPAERPDLGPCWIWTAGVQSQGYGQFAIGSNRDGTRGQSTAHTWAYRTLVGPVPDGLELDHLCRNRRCCNPLHLEPVTHAENTLRGTSPMAANGSKTECPNGHEYSGENLHHRPGGQRRCLACVTAQNAARRKAVGVNDSRTKHKCPSPGCERTVPYTQFACRAHWFAIPAEIRSRIWAGWRSHNEQQHNQAMIDGAAYLEAQAAVA